MSEKKVLTIERAKWRRGGDRDVDLKVFGETALLNEKGYMCCLGFDARARGVPKSAIRYVGEPAEVEGESRVCRKYVDWAARHDGDISDAIGINDASKITEPERERRVRAALIKLGWDDVVFV